MITDIEKIGKSQFKYHITDLDSLESFTITDNWVMKESWTEPKPSNFIKDVLADNCKPCLPTEKLGRIRNSCPLYFNAVYLKKKDRIVQIPMTTEDIVIIPNGQVRGLNQIAMAIGYL